jgi:hypothetical protein
MRFARPVMVYSRFCQVLLVTLPCDLPRPGVLNFGVARCLTTGQSEPHSCRVKDEGGRDSKHLPLCVNRWVSLLLLCRDVGRWAGQGKCRGDLRRVMWLILCCVSMSGVCVGPLVARLESKNEAKPWPRGATCGWYHDVTEGSFIVCTRGNMYSVVFPLPAHQSWLVCGFVVLLFKISHVNALPRGQKQYHSIGLDETNTAI